MNKLTIPLSATYKRLCLDFVNVEMHFCFLFTKTTININTDASRMINRATRETIVGVVADGTESDGVFSKYMYNY